MRKILIGFLFALACSSCFSSVIAYAVLMNGSKSPTSEYYAVTVTGKSCSCSYRDGLCSIGDMRSIYPQFGAYASVTPMRFAELCNGNVQVKIKSITYTPSTAVIEYE